jgi:hypothetical protein
MQPLDLLVSASITVLSLGLLTLSLLSYFRNRNSKMLFVSLVFLVFLIKGIVVSLSLFFEDMNLFDSMMNIWFFDLVILVLLYVASLKR